MIKILSNNGQKPGEFIKTWLNETFKGALMTAPKKFSSILKSMTIQHWNNKYPGSQHFNGSKITESNGSSNNTSATGGIVIDAAGINRAYSDIVIVPIRAKCLTIPLHREAYGRPAGEIQGLFGVKGKNALFVNKGQGLVAMYALANRVIQKRDESMMPSDSSFKSVLGKRFIDEVKSWMSRTAK